MNQSLQNNNGNNNGKGKASHDEVNKGLVVY